MHLRNARDAGRIPVASLAGDSCASPMPLSCSGTRAGLLVAHRSRAAMGICSRRRTSRSPMRMTAAGAVGSAAVSVRRPFEAGVKRLPRSCSMLEIVIWVGRVASRANSEMATTCMVQVHQAAGAPSLRATRCTDLHRNATSHALPLWPPTTRSTLDEHASGWMRPLAGTAALS